MMPWCGNHVSSHSISGLMLCMAMLVGGSAFAQDPGAGRDSDAKAFGARPSVHNLSMSPDGWQVAYVAAGPGTSSMVYTYDLKSRKPSRPVLSVDGKSAQIGSCGWAGNSRLACEVFSSTVLAGAGAIYATKLIALDARDGGHMRMLTARRNSHLMYGGEIIDWMPDKDGSILMTRVGDGGLGVDQIDTRTGITRTEESPSMGAVDYIADGFGHVRIMEIMIERAGLDSGLRRYLYRDPDGSSWKTLSIYNMMTGEGFQAVAVDPNANLAYGFDKKNGRIAAYSMTLDGSATEMLVYARPDVDIDNIILLGKHRRVVGVSYVTDIRQREILADDLSGLLASFSGALPGKVGVVDASADESRMLVKAASDTDPGVYYIFDRSTHQLETFLVVRDQLEGRQLATEQPVQYPASDGVQIPGYLTLPPGKTNAKGLPAIVMPHGGPSSRDEWGFDWLAQFFAARGYAVLQPNFRGSSGYGDAWFRDQGFKAWPVAIGDVIAGGQWLVAQGADPDRLAIMGWSYGGYAALQSAVVDHDLFKAVIAVAPVTDLASLKTEHRDWSDFNLVSDMVGSGPQVEAGSPAQQADKITVPVLLFHGGLDANVSINQSRLMASRLEDAHRKVELVTWDNLDHQLQDSDARAKLLATSDKFLQDAFAAETMSAAAGQ